jgi:hypothetical protein
MVISSAIFLPLALILTIFHKRSQQEKEEGTMKIACRRLLTTAAFLLPLVFVSTAMGEDGNKFQWILFSDTPPQSAMASDGSTILIEGTGTFVVGESDKVTGGGTWATFNGSGAATGKGNFRVTRLISFDLAPGSAPGYPNFHAGLAFFRIAYDDGSPGILAVSCSLNFFGPTTPPSVPEGFSASKAYVDYWEGFINGDSIFVAMPGKPD